MPSHLVTWYKDLKQEWDKIVEYVREACTQKLHDEVTSLNAMLADPVNKSETDYLRDLKADIKGIQETLREVEVLD